MNTHIWQFDLNPNVGAFDKICRYAVGVGLLGVTLAVAPTPIGWVVVLPLVAIPILISAIIGWDPMYAMFQKLPIPKLPAPRLKPAVEH
jgi:hypothetical protein